MFQPTIGFGAQAADLIAQATQVINNEIAIPYDENNHATRELTRWQPLTELLFFLTGGITIGTANATALKPGGALNLIDELVLSLDNDFQLMKLPGRYFRILSHLYDRHKRTATEPGLTVGSHPIAHGFAFPIDVGGGYSALDASQANILAVDCKWASPSKVLTPAGTTTLAVNAGTQLKIQTKSLGGYPSGERGGVNFPYLRHMWQYNNRTITASGEDRFTLTKRRLYSGLALFANDANDVATDGIVTNIKLQVGTTVIKTWDPEVLRDENIKQYKIQDPADMTGVYVIPWGEREQIEHQVSITGGQEMELVYETSTTGKLVLAQDYFLAPVNA